MILFAIGVSVVDRLGPMHSPQVCLLVPTLSLLWLQPFVSAVNQGALERGQKMGIRVTKENRYSEIRKLKLSSELPYGLQCPLQGPRVSTVSQRRGNSHFPSTSYSDCSEGLSFHCIVIALLLH